jgi:hypothetical protein
MKLKFSIKVSKLFTKFQNFQLKILKGTCKKFNHSFIISENTQIWKVPFQSFETFNSKIKINVIFFNFQLKL